MDPLDALTVTPRTKAPADSAPAAAGWLRNPSSIEKRITLAQQLASEPAWTPPPTKDTE